MLMFELLGVTYTLECLFRTLWISESVVLRLFVFTAVAANILGL